MCQLLVKLGENMYGRKVSDIANELTCFLCKYDILEDLDIIGCDSTAVNTGNKGGVIAVIEKTTGKRKLCQICQLHLNELPLRHVFTEIDGDTDSKNTFKGVIGNYSLSDFNVKKAHLLEMMKKTSKSNQL